MIADITTQGKTFQVDLSAIKGKGLSNLTNNVVKFIRSQDPTIKKALGEQEVYPQLLELALK